MHANRRGGRNRYRCRLAARAMEQAPARCLTRGSNKHVFRGFPLSGSPRCAWRISPKENSMTAKSRLRTTLRARWSRNFNTGHLAESLSWYAKRAIELCSTCCGAGTRASRSPAALDEMFELFDNEFLITDNAFYHVANRNYPNQSSTFEHRKMTHGFCGHHSHAFLD
jgi:hypothetical protein